MKEAELLLPPPDAVAATEKQYGLQPSQGELAKRVPHGELFPMRPPETGPGDQLVLAGVDVDDQVSMSEMVEMFAKHREDPDHWTPMRLAEHYQTREEWVRALLQYTMAPTFVQVEGDIYGVYDVIGGPQDTEDGRAAKRLQLRAERAKKQELIEAAQRNMKRLGRTE
jgi:hypothetical protein